MSTLQHSAESRSQAFVRTYLLRRPAVVASLLCLGSFAAFWTAQRLTGVSMIDLMVYRAEGWTVRTGGDLYAMRATYAQLPNTYPPFAALLFMPLTLLDVAPMRTLATAGNLVLLVAFVHLFLKLLGRPARASRPAATLLIASLAVWCEPVWTTLRYGQVNLLLATLVLWDLSRRNDHRWAGVGIGVAAGIKLTPALFVIFLLLCGLIQWRRRSLSDERSTAASWWNPPVRRAAFATGTFLGTVLLGAIVLPYDSRRFWFDALFQSERVGHTDITDNQSLRGVLARLLHTGDPGWPWAAVACVVVVLGLGAAVAAASAGERRLPFAPAWAAVACAVTALLVSPVSWSHHWVWCIPLVVLLGTETLRRHRALLWRTLTGTAALVFCSYALWLVPHGVTGPVRPELDQNAGEMMLSAAYPAAGLGFLALTAVLAVRALRKPAPYEPGR
ncbi:glycosyltransferase 87 family protein [Streptomyces ovatisporus]|uniref:Glycosyltransferase 87 family protein n=1 Tax=Streptomyces ovatisporus TaxID=1128682 RepID=A0ABV9A0N4_9ACTN